MGKSKVKIELNLKGINEMMKSPEMQEILSNEGMRVASIAGDDYSSRVHTADYIAIANVYATTPEARKDNLKNNTLLKAVGSAAANK